MTHLRYSSLSCMSMLVAAHQVAHQFVNPTAESTHSQTVLDRADSQQFLPMYRAPMVVSAQRLRSASGHCSELLAASLSSRSLEATSKLSSTVMKASQRLPVFRFPIQSSSQIFQSSHSEISITFAVLNWLSEVTTACRNCLALAQSSPAFAGPAWICRR